VVEVNLIPFFSNIGFMASAQSTDTTVSVQIMACDNIRIGFFDFQQGLHLGTELPSGSVAIFSEMSHFFSSNTFQ